MASTEIMCDLFIDGGEREPQSGAYSVRENPATEKLGSSDPGKARRHQRESGSS